MTSRSFDRRSRARDDLAAIFDHFGEVECPQLDGELYRVFCRGIREDDELLAIAAHAPATQPPPNLLFAAVHYLLLGGEPHELREWYPALGSRRGRNAASAFPVFRAFCLRHRDRIESLIEQRLTQTNVITRCSTTLPAFALAFVAGGERPLSMIEIGASAGLNLQWDRFHYRYGERLRWGDPASPVTVPCDLRGAPPALPDEIPVAWRRGVDLHPVDISDPDAVLWLRALIWPEHIERQRRLSNAIDIARSYPPEIVEGDASQLLPELIAAAPRDTTLCVFATHTLYQFPRQALRETLQAMQRASRERDVYFASMEATGDGCSEVRFTAYRGGERDIQLIARCNPHGRWLEWLGSPPRAPL